MKKEEPSEVDIITKKHEKLSEDLKQASSVSLDDVVVQLAQSLVEKIDEIGQAPRAIAPFGDWAKIIEGTPKIKAFMLEECVKPETWKLVSMARHDNNENIYKLYFANVAVDDGDSVGGVAYVTKSGKIKLAFAQGEE